MDVVAIVSIWLAGTVAAFLACLLFMFWLSRRPTAEVREEHELIKEAKQRVKMQSRVAIRSA